MVAWLGPGMHLVLRISGPDEFSELYVVFTSFVMLVVQEEVRRTVEHQILEGAQDVEVDSGESERMFISLLFPKSEILSSPASI